MAEIKIALEELKEASYSDAAPARRRLKPVLLAVACLAVAAGAGLTWKLLRPVPIAEAHPKLVPLTTYPGSERYPTFSPDGSQVAFSWNGEKQDNYNIYVKLVDGGAPLRLTTNLQSEYGTAWSPNGRYIAFQRDNGIYLISPLGGPERKVCQLTSSRSSLSWSPDSKSLAVADRLTSTDPSEIFLVSSDTGEKRTLTEPPQRTYGDTRPAFSPKGRTVAFLRFTVEGIAAEDIFLMPAGGGTAARLTAYNHGMPALAWTPDGSDLIFSSRRSSSSALWRLPANAPQGAETKLVPGVTGDPGELAISRSGANDHFRLGYSSYTADSDVWRCDLPHADHPTRLIASTRMEFNAKYSPVQLTSFGSNAGSPRWSPDGLRIVFEGINAGNRDVYVIASQGGSARRMTTEPSVESRPSFSRDCRWIYFMSDRSGTRQIWKLPSDGGAAVQVTKQGGQEPNESPDGKLLYYVKETRAPGLRSVPVDGGEEITVAASVLQGDWGIADKGIYFLDSQTTPSKASGHPLRFYDFQTRRISEMGKLESAGGSFSVSPDGRSALFTRNNRGDSDLFLLENLR